MAAGVPAASLLRRGYIYLIYSPYLHEKSKTDSESQFVSPEVRRRGRAFNRGMAGFMVDGDILHYQFITFTTPESQLDEGEVDEKRELWYLWKRFKRRLSYEKIQFPHFAVVEYNKRRTCKHIHCIVRTEWIDYKRIHDIWNEVSGSVWSKAVLCCGRYKRALVLYSLLGLVDNDGFYCTVYNLMYEAIASPRGIMMYVLKYMTKAPEGGKSYWYSRDWVFGGYASVNRDYVRLSGEFPDASWLMGDGMDEVKRSETFKRLFEGLRSESLNRGKYEQSFHGYVKESERYQRVTLRSKSSMRGVHYISEFSDSDTGELYRKAVRDNLHVTLSCLLTDALNERREWLYWWIAERSWMQTFEYWLLRKKSKVDKRSEGE